ncbi:MAG: hypothetical protein JXA94_04490 [Parachlamydiales bacterium]|nr:hypothetical protein [Parachlamydiales bacterium]
MSFLIPNFLRPSTINRQIGIQKDNVWRPYLQQPPKFHPFPSANWSHYVQAFDSTTRDNVRVGHKIDARYGTPTPVDKQRNYVHVTFAASGILIGGGLLLSGFAALTALSASLLGIGVLLGTAAGIYYVSTFKYSTEFRREAIRNKIENLPFDQICNSYIWEDLEGYDLLRHLVKKEASDNEVDRFYKCFKQLRRNFKNINTRNTEELGRIYDRFNNDAYNLERWKDLQLHTIANRWYLVDQNKLKDIDWTMSKYQTNLEDLNDKLKKASEKTQKEKDKALIYLDNQYDRLVRSVN